MAKAPIFWYEGQSSKLECLTSEILLFQYENIYQNTSSGGLVFQNVPPLYGFGPSLISKSIQNTALAQQFGNEVFGRKQPI